MVHRKNCSAVAIHENALFRRVVDRSYLTMWQKITALFYGNIP